MYSLLDLPLRIREKIEINANGCWIWTGCVSEKNYSRMWWEGREYPGHILVWKLLKGEFPEGKLPDHNCHDPEICDLANDCPHRPCVYPEHITPATHSENTKRSSKVVALRKLTHCKWEHEFTPENTRIRSNGTRGCKTCERNAKRTGKREG